VRPDVEISLGSATDIPQLREAFLSLHDHHRRLSAVALTEPHERVLRARAIPNLTVAVMCTNEAAIRLYRRRGLVPGELILYRIGDALAEGRRRPD
jgi:ribosomal protein S18 acetylase RimI-like enzyme